MRNINFIKRENDLNKIVRELKETPEDTDILFISEWDEHCTTLVNKLVGKYGFPPELMDENVQNIHVVSSFETPHSFVIFNTTKVPHLISYRGGNVFSEEYTPRIYKKLGLK